MWTLLDRVDIHPEGSGLSNDHIAALKNLDSAQAKIIFMHHPIITAERDEYDCRCFDDPSILCYKDILPNTDKCYVEAGAIIHYRRDFINYCKNNNVKLVLSGHTHDARVFDDTGNESNENETARPLFIQTQSATKGDDHHGYRIIDVDVKNGAAIPRVSEETEFHSKIIADLDQNEDIRLVRFKVYEDPVKLDSYFQNKDYNFSIPYFMANSSDRVILYDYTNDFSSFNMSNLFPEDDEYDLFVSKNEEDFTKFALYYFRNYGITGFRVKNSEYCKNPLSGEKCDGGFLAIYNIKSLITGNKINILKLKEMNIKSNSEDNLFINWPLLSLTSNASSELLGANLVVNGNGDTVFGKIGKEIIVDLHSPGELQVLDSTGRVSGLVNGKIKEEIPYSIYDEMNEAVVLFVDEGVEDDQYAYKVVGSDNATYGLSITKKEEHEGIEDAISFDASSIPTGTKIVHQYTIDWDALSRGEKGVTLQIDVDGDGVFEQTIKADAMLQPPTADANGPYVGNEGSPITLDASQSSDPDGEIVLYEWDFDDDGEYEVSSNDSMIQHTWGDDYQGKIILRVTDDEGLTDIATTTVTVNNVAPAVEAGHDQEVFAGDTVQFFGSFTDPGWLDTHTYEWDFDASDGIQAEATGQNPTHIYYGAGAYTVTLTVTDDDGGVGTDTLQVVVKPIPATIRIEPETLNLASKGEFTAFITFSEPYNITDINISTVVCEGAPAVKGMVADDNKYIAKFNREDLRKDLPTGDAVKMTITGKVSYNLGLADFEGLDTIRVVDKGKN